MVAARVLHRGTVKDGVIVPDDGVDLPNGTVVQFAVDPLAFTPEERAEFEGWEKVGNEAWAMIEECERAEGRTWANVLARPEGASDSSPG